MCRTIHLKVRFEASPDEIYAYLTDAKLLSALSGKPARFDAKPGGRFSNYAGAVEGIVVDLVPGKRLVQAWREREFPEGIYSMAAFKLAKTARGGTELDLTHRGVPKHLIPRIIEEWRRNYWDKMKAYSSGTGPQGASLRASRSHRKS